jgi:hypothetical protein
LPAAKQAALPAAKQAALQAALQAARLGKADAMSSLKRAASMHLIVSAITCVASQLSGLGRVLVLGQCRPPALACGLLCRADGAGAAFLVLCALAHMHSGTGTEPYSLLVLSIAFGCRVCHKQLSAGLPYTKGAAALCVRVTKRAHRAHHMLSATGGTGIHMLWNPTCTAVSSWDADLPQTLMFRPKFL